LRTIKELGLSARDSDVLMDELSKTYTMVLVTGPEGSDKSATLYAALLELKSQDLRILTLEDPVTYHLGGIDQVRFDRSAGVSIATLAKNMDLKNSDVVMLGEIADAETADCAINTALGKHLVLGKLHAADATDAVVKLTHMGIEARRLKASLRCVIAQRVLRLNCSHCAEVEDVPPVRREALGVKADEVFYRGKGCPCCNHTGFQGRAIVYELLEMSPDIYTLLEHGAAASEIRQQAGKNGMATLTENALALARARAVSLAEVFQNS
jgi:type IV pilus assembly protein PilB